MLVALGESYEKLDSMQQAKKVSNNKLSHHNCTIQVTLTTDHVISLSVLF